MLSIAFLRRIIRKGNHPFERNSDKDDLNQNHIADRSKTNAEKGVALPQMQQTDQGNCNGFRQTKGKRKNRYAFEAVYDQDRHNSRREHLAQKLDICRYFPVFSKDEKGNDSCHKSTQSYHGDDGDGLDGGKWHGYSFSSCLSV